MDLPLEIAFNKIDKSDWAEAEIRARVDKLVKMHDRITSCRVAVEQRAGSTTAGVPPVVRIELHLAGGAPVVVAYEPDRLQNRYQNPDLRNAISDAFETAERRLSERKEIRTGRTKAMHHDVNNQFLGQIAEMHAEEDHGFLLNKDGGLLYFHRNSVLEGEFDQLRRGDEVHYVEAIGDTGPLATKVRMAASHTAG